MAARTTTDHVNNPAVICAASWFASHRHEIEHPIVPNLRARFGLSAMEVVEALRIAKGAANARAS